MITLQHSWEFEQLFAIWESLEPTATLEIGCWDGGTLTRWMRGGRVVAIDDVCRFADVWQQRADDSETDLHILKGNSHDPEVTERAADLGPFDLIFIDADHSYDAVVQDWADYRPLVRPGGCVAFHDIRRSDTRPDLEVHKLWDELKATPGALTVEIMHTLEDWGGIGVIWV